MWSQTLNFSTSKWRVFSHFWVILTLHLLHHIPPFLCFSPAVPCSAGHFSRTGLVPCYPCPRDYYQPEHGRSYCLSCPFYGTTTVTGATTIQHCSSKCPWTEKTQIFFRSDPHKYTHKPSTFMILRNLSVLFQVQPQILDWTEIWTNVYTVCIVVPGMFQCRRKDSSLRFVVSDWENKVN